MRIKLNGLPIKNFYRCDNLYEVNQLIKILGRKWVTNDNNIKYYINNEEETILFYIRDDYFLSWSGYDSYEIKELKIINVKNLIREKKLKRCLKQ